MHSIIRRKEIYYFLGIVLIFVVWIIGAAIINNPIILPKVSVVFKTLGKLFVKWDTYVIIGNTFKNLFLIIVCCLMLGIFLACLSNISKRFEAFITPSVVFLKTTPVVVIIVLLLIVLGQSKSPYIITGFVVLPIIYEATLSGIKEIDRDIIDEIKMVSNINFRVVLKIHLPLAAPYIRTAILQSIGLGLKVLVMAEFISQKKGTIGYEINFYRNFIMYEYIFAWGIVLIVMVLVADLILKRFKINK